MSLKKQPNETAKAFAARVAAAKAANAGKKATDNNLGESTPFDGVVVEVSPNTFEKSMGRGTGQYCTVAISKNGKDIVVDAVNTLRRPARDEDGNVIEGEWETRESVEPGQEVTVYGQLVDGNPYFTVGTKRLEASSKEEQASLFD